MGTVVGILILAVIVEALVEYFVAPAVKPEGNKPPDPAPQPAGVDWRSMGLRYSAAAIGVALCIVYRCDLLSMAGLHSPYPWVGWLVTGLLIGRGANFVNDFASTWLAPAARLAGR